MSIKSNWKKCKLGDVISVKHGFAFKGAFFTEVPTPYILVTPGNFHIGGSFKDSKLKYYKGPVPQDYILRTADVIVTMTDLSKEGDTLGYSALVPDLKRFLLLHNQRIGLIVLKNNAIEKKFIYWVMRSPHYHQYIVNTASGSTVKHTSPSRIENFEFLCPPLEEQKRIAEILGSLDDKIELLQKQNKTLEDMAKAVFKSWFVDFDVVRAKQKGLPKADIMREYHLTDDLYDLFPSSFADSPLGPIPSGWEVKKAQEIADIAIGRTPPRKETKWFSTDSTDTTWISIKDLGNCGVFIGDSSEYLTEDAVSKFKIPMIPTKTVVLSFKLTVGRVAITMKEMCSNEAIAQFKDAMVPVEYLYLLLKHINFSLLGSTSSIATAINSNTIKNMKVLIADSVLLSAFKERTQNLFDKIEINLKQIQTLTELRDTLLPRLISGKIRV